MFSINALNALAACAIITPIGNNIKFDYFESFLFSTQVTIPGNAIFHGIESLVIKAA